MLALLGAIFGALPALDQLEPGSRVPQARPDPDAREERCLRLWLSSLGIEVSNLYSDCRSGLVILKAEDALQPGVVNWEEVHLFPRSIYHCIENANYACTLAVHSLSLRVVGIGGKDLVDGTPKLVLALVWQLMRLHSLKLLQELGMTDESILSWANAKLQASDPSMRVESFSDVALESGVLLLTLLSSVAPECVQIDQVESALLPYRAARLPFPHKWKALSSQIRQPASLFPTDTDRRHSR